jgi:glycosyltransferase involved in cell wall biosynthesis
VKSKVSVTIGIPTYDRLHYLREAVASARDQTYPNIEILISQNPHQDRRIREEIAEYCQGVAARDQRIRYERRPHNVGQTGNFQWLVDNAYGDYILLIGDDDHVIPNAIETLVSHVAPEVVVAFGRRKIIDASGRVQPRCVLPEDPDVEFFEGWPFTQYEVPAGRLANAELWAWRQAMGVETSLVRTRDFRRLPYRDIDVPDIEFFIWLAREGGTFIFGPEYVTEYRLHVDSSTGRGFNDFKQLFDRLEPLPVCAELEPYKRKLLEVMAFKGTSKCLLRGDLDDARRLLSSRYYPSPVRARSKGLIMKLCAALPGQFGPGAYKFLYAVKNRRRYEVPTEKAVYRARAAGPVRPLV